MMIDPISYAFLLMVRDVGGAIRRAAKRNMARRRANRGAPKHSATE